MISFIYVFTYFNVGSEEEAQVPAFARQVLYNWAIFPAPVGL